MRPVINLKQLNQWVYTEHFKMEGIPTLRDLVRPGDWFVKVDLKDACPHRLQPPAIPEVHAGQGELPVHVPPLHLHVYQGAETYDDPSQVMGVRIIVYIDDMLILVETSEQASQHLETLL